ncbi:MAG TPA: AAA family ATPase [Gemmatimonadales bacterium]|jgi:cell division protease FtsH|nr:AAA family ATPase [Gemmatimonadales bacterium]
MNNPSFRPRLWILSIALGTVLVAVSVAYSTFSTPRLNPPRTVAYSELVGAMQAGTVDSVRIRPAQEILGWLKGSPGEAAGEIRVIYSSREVSAFLAAAQASSVALSFEPEPRDYGALVGLGVSIVFIVAAVVILRRQMSTGSGSVGTSRKSSNLTFQNVAGNIEALGDLQEIVGFLKEPERFAALGARIPKGVLLEGPPGTGKTLMARALAGEAGVAFFAASGSEFTGTFVGQGVSRVKGLFKKARKAGKAVIFIDEIDTIGGRRGRQQGHSEDDRTLNQLLVELDGFDPSAGIVVLGATNRAGDLDPALLRKGRFDRSVSVALPTVTEREAILLLHIQERQVPLAPDVDLLRLARLMTGTSGAELAGLINEAAILAVRGEQPKVTWAHLEEARDRVLLGRARGGLVVNDTERRLVALHEAGHAIAGVAFCAADPLHKVTIQPRGQAMGVAFFQPDHENHIASRDYLEGQILKGLGGRAAEEVVFGASKVTSGAASDLQHTTRIAKHMIYRLGMGETAGLIAYDPDSGPVSAETHARMDADVRALLETSYATITAFLRQHRPALEALANALLEQETLTGEEAIAIMEAAGFRKMTLVA